MPPGPRCPSCGKKPSECECRERWAREEASKMSESVCAETTEEDWRTPMSKGDFANLMLLIQRMADTHLQIAKGFERTTEAITMLYNRQEELMAIAQAQAAMFSGGLGGKPN